MYSPGSLSLLWTGTTCRSHRVNIRGIFKGSKRKEQSEKVIQSCQINGPPNTSCSSHGGRTVGTVVLKINVSVFDMRDRNDASPQRQQEY